MTGDLSMVRQARQQLAALERGSKLSECLLARARRRLGRRMANQDEIRTAETEFRSLDGTTLRGTVVMPPAPLSHVVVLVHGGGVTREEGGFFRRIAAGLADAGVGSLRFDLRGHGASDGPQECLKLAGVVNDIRAAVRHAGTLAGAAGTSVLGASFGGGLAALFAARYPDKVQRLVLLYPLFNYKGRLIDEKPYWSDDYIDADAARELSEQGFVAHSPSFRLGRPLLNELFYLRPREELAKIGAPTLVVHGTADTFIPVSSSREHITKINAETKLIEVEGAQHGLAVHDDPQYLNPQSQEWQAQAILDIVSWITTDA